MLSEIFLKSIKLNPAELILINKPCYIDTILGSCVSITMFHQKKDFSIMCHAMLPKCSLLITSNCHEDIFKYVDTSVEYMKKKIKESFYRISDFDVKIFGGADVLSSLNKTREISIGKMNTQVAFEMLKDSGFNILSYDIGGNYGRRIIFNTENGEVLVKKLSGIPDYSDYI